MAKIIIELELDGERLERLLDALCAPATVTPAPEPEVKVTPLRRRAGRVGGGIQIVETISDAPIAAAPTTDAPAAEAPVKRKRGRPRKVPIESIEIETLIVKEVVEVEAEAEVEVEVEEDADEPPLESMSSGDLMLIAAGLTKAPSNQAEDSDAALRAQVGFEYDRVATAYGPVAARSRVVSVMPKTEKFSSIAQLAARYLTPALDALRAYA